MDLIKSTSFMQGGAGAWTPNLVPGGETWDPSVSWSDCNDATLAFDDWGCQETVPGVGLIHTQWWITATDDPRLLHIRVQSEGQGVLSQARSRAEFTTFRSCTRPDPTDGGCPES